MSGNKIIKSVSFNVTNENDRECLEWIENMNFSGYVKQLIIEDLKLGEQAIIHDFVNPLWLVKKNKQK